MTNLTPGKLAPTLGISTDTIIRRVKAGHIRGAWISLTNRVYLPDDAAEQFTSLLRAERPGLQI
jgi:predicted site-specific integrase-resolvase